MTRRVDIATMAYNHRIMVVLAEIKQSISALQECIQERNPRFTALERSLMIRQLVDYRVYLDRLLDSMVLRTQEYS